jgi:hypothetical protein
MTVRWSGHDGDPRILWLGAQEPRTTAHWTPRAGQRPSGDDKDGCATAIEMVARIGHVTGRVFDKISHCYVRGRREQRTRRQGPEATRGFPVVSPLDAEPAATRQRGEERWARTDEDRIEEGGKSEQTR